MLKLKTMFPVPFLVLTQ